MSDEENEEQFKISCSLGELSLTVDGSDPDCVKETFDEEWEERLSESADMAKALRDGDRSHR